MVGCRACSTCTLRREEEEGAFQATRFYRKERLRKTRSLPFGGLDGGTMVTQDTYLTDYSDECGCGMGT